MNKKNLHKGFSLLETLLYLGIFSIIGGSLFGILTNVTRVSTREISGSEVSSQLQFAMETVSRLVRESSNIETATTSVSILKLRMADPLLDPTCVFLENGALKLSQGPDALLPQNCTAASTVITTDKVVVDKALFRRVEFPGGHDQVAVDLQFSNMASGASKISRALRSGISRVSAATFDSDLLPNVTDVHEVGASISGGKRWRNISISNLLNLGVISGDPEGIDGSIYYNSTDKTFRGKADGAWSNLGSSLWIATSTNAMYAGVSGNVGIGTANPVQKLDVNGGSAIRGTLFVGNGTQSVIRKVTANVPLYFQNAGGTAEVVINANGNVGVGTVTPATKLSIKQALDNVQQGVSVMNAADSIGLYLWSGGDIAHIDGCDDANCRVAINGSGTGNVGIGTVNPSYKLQVAGDVGATAFYYTSDRRLKDEIKNIDVSDAKNKIMQLQGVSFVWKEGGSRDMGLIAQEVETVYPELVRTSADGIKSIQYAGLIAPLIETIKMQQKEIDDLKGLMINK